MDPRAAVLSLLLAQPAYYTERPDDTRRERLEMVADELAPLAPELAAAAVVQGQHESGFARYVWEGCTEVPKGSPDCDRGRARGYWQHWEVGCRDAYRYPAGTPESLHEEVKCFVRHWTGNTYRCRRGGVPAVQAGFAGFAFGCGLKSAAARAAEHDRTLGRLLYLRAKPEPRDEYISIIYWIPLQFRAVA